MLVDALAARRGGTAFAAVQVARRLAERSDVGPVRVVTRAGSLVDSGLAGNANGGLTVHRLGRERPGEIVTRLAWEAASLRRQARDRPVLSWSGMLPVRPAGPLVGYLANPVAFERDGALNRTRRAAMRRTASWSRVVLVPSATQARLVERTLGCPVEVVPLGLDHVRFVPAAAEGDELLYVADFYPHKRHDLVLDAWQLLPEPRPILRFIGRPPPAAEWYRSMLERTVEWRRSGELVMQSGLPLADLVAAYHGARLALVASEHESFSLPVLEAQACAVAVVLRDTPILRETSGGAAAYVAGDDPREWERALRSLLGDAAQRAAIRERGLANAARYSWERTAAEIAARIN